MRTRPFPSPGHRWAGSITAFEHVVGRHGSNTVVRFVSGFLGDDWVPEWGWQPQLTRTLA
jgi:hypothetical protein